MAGAKQGISCYFWAHPAAVDPPHPISERSGDPAHDQPPCCYSSGRASCSLASLPRRFYQQQGLSTHWPALPNSQEVRKKSTVNYFLTALFKNKHSWQTAVTVQLPFCCRSMLI